MIDSRLGLGTLLIDEHLFHVVKIELRGGMIVVWAHRHFDHKTTIPGNPDVVLFGADGKLIVTIRSTTGRGPWKVKPGDLTWEQPLQVANQSITYAEESR